MGVSSRIDMGEVVENQDFRFGQQRQYFPAMVKTYEGEKPALFTFDQIEVAIQRAMANPEDAPKRSMLAEIFECFAIG